ncbi:UNKNOWN [Stylonychia lemnae]|uniref:Uncharacterized protein n=1 Tax=Stylonychia lemnae TaxID=5949 RepID=A0A078AUL1_STYLE|nr:UNKNOWN [Stylonychia lemnae]|eukprot:CDW84568.1 UNKNOWN [Stylonychia lemnae]
MKIEAKEPLLEAFMTADEERGRGKNKKKKRKRKRASGSRNPKTEVIENAIGDKIEEQIATWHKLSPQSSKKELQLNNYNVNLKENQLTVPQVFSPQDNIQKIQDKQPIVL